MTHMRSLFRTAPFAAILASLFMASAASAQTPVTSSNPNGWGADPYRLPITGTQDFSNLQSPDGNGSYRMTVTNNGTTRTGFARHTLAPAGYGLLRDITTLAFSSMNAASLIQTPTLRLYLDVANPFGGRMVGQLGFYADGSINGAPSSAWTTHDLLDGDGNNNMFLRFFSGNALPSGQIGTNCVNSNRGSDFNARMQSIASWLGSCNGGMGELDLSDAKVTGIALDMGAYPGDGSITFDNYMDRVSMGFSSDKVPTEYDFQADAVSVVPEPSTYALMGAGLFAVGFVGRKRIRKNIATA